MEGFLLSFVSCLICFLESFFIFWLLYEKFNTINYFFWGLYSVTILAINIIPAYCICPGEPLFGVSTIKTAFAISSIGAIFSVITFFIFTNTKSGDDSIISTLTAYLAMSLYLILIFTIIDFTSVKILDRKTYDDYYEIFQENGKPSIVYLSDKDEKNSYYVIEYKSPSDDGNTSINIIQISPSDLDIIVATEEQDKDYLIITTTEVTKKDKHFDLSKTIIEKTYSYKLLIRNDIHITNIIPIRNT